MASPSRLLHQRGTSMLEVLVTIVILALGLLGVAGLQTRLQMSEMEGYQRSQAMILLEDMAHRLAANRNNAAAYETGTATPYGAAMTCPSANATLKDRDVREWCLALQGASEKQGSADVGAMLGGRGCVEARPNNEYMITVAWQGLGAVSAPPSTVACGVNQYDGGAGSSCTGDKCRRAVTTLVKIAPL
jgi:type IV pilus assembly protein PilV